MKQADDRLDTNLFRQNNTIIKVVHDLIKECEVNHDDLVIVNKGVLQVPNNLRISNSSMSFKN